MQRHVGGFYACHGNMPRTTFQTFAIVVIVIVSPCLLLYVRLVHQLGGDNSHSCEHRRSTEMALDSVLYDKVVWDVSVAIYVGLGRVWILHENNRDDLLTGWICAAFLCTVATDAGVGTLAMAGTSLCHGERPVVIGAVCAKQQLSDRLTSGVLFGTSLLIWILFARTCLRLWKSPVGS